MLKFENLVIPDLDQLINRSLETTRVGLSISQKDFDALIDADPTAIFGIVDDTLTEFVIGAVPPNYLADIETKLQKNQGTILSEHKEMFHFYFLFVHTCFNVFENARNAVDKTTMDIRDTTLICLYGNLCRMADEIGSALSNGYTTMALTLWRAFYEHAVIGIFLLKEDSVDLFQKFADFSHRDLKKQAESFGKHWEALKFPPLSDELKNSIENRTAELKSNYGNEFLEEYAWAKDAFKEKKRVQFYDIESHAGMSRYRPFYIWASNYIHPNFTSLTDFKADDGTIVLQKITSQVLAKKSYIDPMQLTLITFYIYNDYFLHRYSANGQYSTNILVLKKLIDKLKAVF
jgi:hypothetical protein